MPKTLPIGMVKCRTCGATYSEFGDGWEGECPDCADRTYAKEFPNEFGED
jgi:DNA-directed RNA polymerase subunit RPC12/RpoP